MRVLGLLLRVAGYIAIWVAIVLAFGLLTALLPSLWRLVQPSSPESYDLGLVSLVAGFIGLFVGVWPAILGVEWLVQRNDRRARERSLRSNESRT
jgi:predicted metal-binding membrane protein